MTVEDRLRQVVAVLPKEASVVLPVAVLHEWLDKESDDLLADLTVAELASPWLIEAEKVAQVPKQDGSLWHAYRRKWATERKDLPDADVAAAGGWSDTSTLREVYQQADMETMYRVVSEPTSLREA